MIRAPPPAAATLHAAAGYGRASRAGARGQAQQLPPWHGRSTAPWGRKSSRRASADRATPLIDTQRPAASQPQLHDALRAARAPNTPAPHAATRALRRAAVAARAQPLALRATPQLPRAGRGWPRARRASRPRAAACTRRVAASSRSCIFVSSAARVATVCCRRRRCTRSASDALRVCSFSASAATGDALQHEHSARTGEVRVYLPASRGLRT